MQCKAYCYATTGNYKFHNLKAQQRRVALWQAKIPVGTRVKVYKNLHEDCYSIQDAKTGIVIGYCSSIVLTDPTFSVGEAGREKVVRTGQKNVHAKVCGFYASHEASLFGSTTQVTYNPHKYSSFVRKVDESTIKSAKIALLDASGIKVIE